MVVRVVGAAYNRCLVGADFQFLCGAGTGVLSLCMYVHVCVCVCLSVLGLRALPSRTG